MRICSPQLRLSPNATLGGEVYDREVLKHLAQAGVKVDIILPKGQSYEQNITNWRIHNAPFRRGYRWYISNLIFPHLIKKVYDQTHFQILRVHSLRFTGPAALWARKWYKLPTPIVAHHHHLDGERIESLIDKNVIKASSLVITDSHFAKAQLSNAFGIDTSHVKVIYGGTDSNKFKPTPKNRDLLKAWQLTAGKILFTLGSLEPRKNLSTLLDVFRLVIDKMDKMPNQVTLVIGGSGSELANLKAYAASLGLENHVRFTGFISEADKVAFYNLADIYVTTSSMEGFGLTTAEAMACGKPTVVSDAGSLPEVVLNNKTGFVTSTNAPELFAQKIVTLLTDDNLAHQFGQAVKVYVKQNFNWDMAAQKMLSLYQGLIERQSANLPGSTR